MSTHQSSHKGRRPRSGGVMVFGCGLIGGSIGMRLRRSKPTTRVFGVDRPRVIRRAHERRAIDEGASLRSAWGRLARATPETIVLALPVQAIVEILAPLAEATRALPAERRPLIVDVGSVKADIVDVARRVGCPRFVGGHPMAGHERGGIEHARADLLEGASFALCSATDEHADLRDAKRLVRRLGARPMVVDARTHDRAVAMTSHVPHVLAWTLIDAARELGEQLDHPRMPLALAGGSWADATRVAASDPRLWSAILEQNREQVSRALTLVLDRLERVQRALDDGRDPLSGHDPALPAAELAALARRRARRAR